MNDEQTEVTTALELKAFEAWASEKHTPAFLVAAAKVRMHWGEGKELSAVDFDAAIQLVSEIRISG